MNKQRAGLPFLGILALCAPLAMANSPAPTYPEISHDVYNYSCEVNYIGSVEDYRYYSLSVVNDSAYDMFLQGLVARFGNTTMSSSYVLSNLFVPRASAIPATVFRVYGNAFWTGSTPEGMSVTLTGSLSRGEITEAGEETFTCPTSSLSFVALNKQLSTSVAETSYSDIAILDNSTERNYVRQFANAEGKIISFYGYGGSKSTDYNKHTFDLYDPNVSAKSGDYTYLKTYRLAIDPNQTKPTSHNYWGALGLVLSIVLYAALILVIVGVLAVVIVAMVKVCQHA
jgi:hypothetical protein